MEDMKEYRGIFYEVKTDGKYHFAYFHKLIGPNHYEVVGTMTYLSDPSDKRLQSTIDQEIFGEW